MIKPLTDFNKILVFLLLSLLLASCSTAADSSKTLLREGVWYPVTDYVDGDTFKINANDKAITVRMLYIDTPETVKPNTEVEPFGPEASAYTKELLAASGEVKLAFDTEQKDKYGRTLAVIELKDGRILNELLLEEGLAEVLIVEPNVKQENIYKKLEQEAKQAGVGIWQNMEKTQKTEVPVKTAAPTGITIEVDKRAELTTITNHSDNAYSLKNWKLVSVKGNQTFKFSNITLDAKGTITIISKENESSNASSDLIYWGESNVWNNSEADPAELYNAQNELVAVWKDEQ